MNIISVAKMDSGEIEELLLLGERVKNGEFKDSLKETYGALFFPESSIRTRMSFEKGIDVLGGKKILFPSKTLDKKEEHRDVLGYMENWADYVVIRYGDYDKLEKIANLSGIPIINAMTKENHPCEILSDFMSIRERRPDYRNLTYTFVGEKANISKSYANAAKVLGLKFNHVFFPGNRIMEESENYHFTSELSEVIEESDVILVDPCGEEYKTEEYYKKYRITMDIMKRAKEDAIINPCPPFSRGEEVTKEVIESEYFVGYEFKKNLQFMHSAIILKALGKDKK